ncbi:Dihydrolipoyllysine-residue acetyltransferase component of pyruvate dehydrogenase complex [bacterium HR29]|jgi:pyruvate dehydrogenase E2 component (dihydrolipoamide acetyltransferase)|nr:Dihydrolipoyllysine-residue acetyltransferase component of pyruvate dehydrogenase complex [bacterium HR29]
MAYEVTMPQMGADMTEGTLVRWLKKVGDRVEKGEVIAEIETDKANVELEAFHSGTVLALIAEEGQVVPVGEVIAYLGEPGEEVPTGKAPSVAAAPSRRRAPSTDGGAAPAAGAPAAEAAAPSAPAAGAMEAPSAAGERLRVSPVARRLAEEAGIDLSTLRGTGPGGRIVRRDVEEAIRARQAAPPPTAPAPTPAAAGAPPTATPAAEAVPTPAGARTEPLTRIRQAIARRMTQSKREQPHYYLTLDIDMTEALAFREALNATVPQDQRVTINDLIVKACAIALQRHPKFTASYSEEGLRYPSQINIDLGIALEEGLIAASLLDVGNKTLGRIAAESKALIERARGGRLRAEEYGSGCFTVTNLGAYGVETLIGIINPPQAAILGVGSVMPKPVVRDGQVVVRQIMKVALSADHRVTDGAEGARFLKEIQSLLENPASLAL